MEMVGHTYAGVYRHFVAMCQLMGGNLEPCFLYCFAKRGEGKGAVIGSGGGGLVAESGDGGDGGFVTENGHKMREEVFASAHYKGDEVGAATIVVVTCITWAIG